MSGRNSKEPGGLQLCHVYNILKPPKSITLKKYRGNESDDGGAREAGPPASGSSDMLEPKVHVLSSVLTNFVPPPR